MTWGEFEWAKELKTQPKYAELTKRLHDEVVFNDDKIREKGFLVTEARTE